jgi:E3 ubiquitin-protein ligase BRE1
VEKELAEAREKLKETRENWAKARGDADMTMKNLDDLQSKHKRRWAELTGEGLDPSEAPDDMEIPIDIKPLEQAQRIIELDHKLKQALENVRQADAVRQNLKEALSMNNSLQSKLDEIKGKYAALQAGRANSSSGGKSSSETTNHGSGSSSNQREKSSSSEKESGSSSKSEKMHREFRRMRKELAALAASKEAAKSKLEVGFCLLV